MYKRQVLISKEGLAKINARFSIIQAPPKRLQAAHLKNKLTKNWWDLKKVEIHAGLDNNSRRFLTKDEKASVHERVWREAANRGVSGVHESEARAWVRSELLPRQKNAHKPGARAPTPTGALVCCNVNLPSRESLKKIAGDKTRMVHYTRRKRNSEVVRPAVLTQSPLMPLTKHNYFLKTPKSTLKMIKTSFCG